MQAFPHHYRVQASAQATGSVRVATDGVDDLSTHAPPEFGGLAGYWSPETLLAGAVGDCFILSFRSVARSSRVEWESIAVDVEGVLERIDGVTRFTRFVITPRLRLGAASPREVEQAHTALQMAKKVCLISNSLNATCELVPVIDANEAFEEASIG